MPQYVLVYHALSFRGREAGFPFSNSSLENGPPSFIILLRTSPAPYTLHPFCITVQYMVVCHAVPGSLLNMVHVVLVESTTLP